MQTDHGGRFSLRLLSATSDQVRYQAELVTAASEYRGTAVIGGSDGHVAFDPPGAPEWLEAAARAVLRSEWRARRSESARLALEPSEASRGGGGTEPPSVVDSGLPWPRRLTRWRSQRE